MRTSSKSPGQLVPTARTKVRYLVRSVSYIPNILMLLSYSTVPVQTRAGIGRRMQRPPRHSLMRLQFIAVGHEPTLRASFTNSLEFGGMVAWHGASSRKRMAVNGGSRRHRDVLPRKSRTFFNQRLKADYPQAANKLRQGKACSLPLRFTLAEKNFSEKWTKLKSQRGNWDRLSQKSGRNCIRARMGQDLCFGTTAITAFTPIFSLTTKVTEK